MSLSKFFLVIVFLYTNGLNYSYANSELYEKRLKACIKKCNQNIGLLDFYRKSDELGMLTALKKKRSNLILKNLVDSDIVENVKNFFTGLLLQIASNYFILKKYDLCIGCCNDLIQNFISEEAKLYHCLSFIKIGFFKEGLRLEILYDLRSRHEFFSKLTIKMKDMEIGKNHLFSNEYKFIRGHQINLDVFFLTFLIKSFLFKIFVDLNELLSILEFSYYLLSNLDNINFVDTQKDVIIFGDTHGQFFDTFGAVISIKGVSFDFKNILYNDKDTIMVFNCNFAECGKYLIENYTFFLILKILYPFNIYLNRGNQVFKNQCFYCDFYKQIDLKYGSNPSEAVKLYDAYKLTFFVLPLATIINRKIFVVYCDLLKEISSIDDILELDRKSFISDKSHKKYNFKNAKIHKEFILESQTLSVNPDNHEKNLIYNFFWDSIITKNFLIKNGFSMIVRSHEYVNNGFESHQDGKIITIFSAPNYCGWRRNRASYIVFKGREEINKDYDNLSYVVVEFVQWPESEVNNIFGYEEDYIYY
ncbi:Serine/threonine-protein phosphatase 5 [Gurleya vavrai]